jgi:hypothetical protein
LRCPEHVFDLLDKEWQVRTIKAYAWGRHPMMLELRGDMFVMGVCTDQFRDVGMRPVIVPVQLLITPIEHSSVLV